MVDSLCAVKQGVIGRNHRYAMRTRLRAVPRLTHLLAVGLIAGTAVNVVMGDAVPVAARAANAAGHLSPDKTRLWLRPASHENGARLLNTAGYRFNQRANEDRDNITTRVDYNLSTKQPVTGDTRSAGSISFLLPPDFSRTFLSLSCRRLESAKSERRYE